MVGYSEGTTLPGSKSLGSRIVNNYVHYSSDSRTGSRVGGLVGYAKNTTLANNYVYGQNTGATLSGALAAMLGTDVHVENCFYEQGFDNKAFGFSSSLDTTAITTFSGSGHAVLLGESLDRNSNLTRQLNRWAHAHGGGRTLQYWHSDTANVNHGYPVFGLPEYQPVYDTLEVATCDSFRVDGTLVEQSGLYYYRVVDSTEFTDSLITLNLTVHYSTLTEVSDTVGMNVDYEGHGFYLTATEIALMREALQQVGTVTVVVSDTLQAETGCDSVVTLYLTVSANNADVLVEVIDLKVYPNPTTRNVTVESDGLQQVELYDGVSRRLATYTAPSSTLTVDLSNRPTGVYFLRIRTEKGTIIKKVIKK